MKYVRISLLSFLIGVIAAVILTKIYWPTIEIKIKKINIGKTIHTVETKYIDVNDPKQCQIAKDCANSDILVTGKIEKNKLSGIAYDACKHTDFSFELQSLNTKKHIIQAGPGWTVKNGYYIRTGYLYKFNFLAIGGGLMLPLNGKDLGVELLLQKGIL